MKEILETKQKWLDEIIRQVEEGDPDLTLADKVRIRTLVYQFVDNYMEAQGEHPKIEAGNIYTCYYYLAPFGYKMPEIDKLIEQDMLVRNKFLVVGSKINMFRQERLKHKYN